MLRVALPLAILACGCASRPPAIPTPEPPPFSFELMSPDLYSSSTLEMNRALGIEGFEFEDFEDVELISGLTIELAAPNSGPFTSLSQTYVEPSSDFRDNSWAGPGALVNTTDNSIWYPPRSNLQKLAARTSFNLDPPAAAFGVGLGNFQADIADHAVLANGLEVVRTLESLPNFRSIINGRNGYLVIRSRTGSTISSVTIELRKKGTNQPLSGSHSDGLVFDHVAIRR